jgi:hypothetical protein
MSSSTAWLLRATCAVWLARIQVAKWHQEQFRLFNVDAENQYIAISNFAIPITGQLRMSGIVELPVKF